MTTLLYHHPVFAQHDTGAGHPERPARIAAILQALQQPSFTSLEWREAPPAALSQIELIHPRPFIEQIQAAIPKQGLRHLDPDTVVSSQSWEAAVRAVGAVCAAVDAVLGGQATNGFCAVRPPGHHAEPSRAMGFCIFNSVAIGAAHARHRHRLERVAIIDFDVHHGNGTQAAFWDQPDYLYLSSHQSPLYPGTGSRYERGARGADNIVNVPLAPHSGGEVLRRAWGEVMGPALYEFRPDLILLSAGFDGHADDPLAQLEFTAEDYAWLTREIAASAQQLCEGRLVSALEGGYNLQALAASVAAHVAVLLSL